ncbi:MAG: hypothetical protein ABR585_12750 [Gemmatimonadaceae bacterium]
MLTLRKLSILLAVVTATACATTGIPPAATPVATDNAAALMAIPITTQSAKAREEFLLGLRDQDLERNVEARAHFEAAVAADPNFALGHLYDAFNATSLAAYRAHLDEAARLAPQASPTEQLWIRAEQRGLDGDVNGQLALASQLTTMTPTDPRALIYLANVQFAAGRPADARATLLRATQVSPNFAQSFIQLGNSYLVVEPSDPTKAETYIRQAMALEPNEPVVHDYMGDVYRAENQLIPARTEYSRMIELDPNRAGAYQQRGHVNSFLGNFSDARADYDRAMNLAAPVDKMGLGLFRPLVNVYEGNPAAAEAELEQQVTTIDAMNLPNAVGAKLGALAYETQIALHNKHLDVAQRAINRMTDLYRQQGEASKSESFKRASEANIDYWVGLLAARRGDFAKAREEAQQMMQKVAPNQNPRKNEGAHEVLGMADLLQGNFQSAAGHLAEANPDDIYVTYNRALALEGAGRTAEAKALFRRVAGWNFNGADTALIKKDAARRGG